MKVFKKFNLPLGACVLVVALGFGMNPSLFTSLCLGFCIGMFTADTISNWKHR